MADSGDRFARVLKARAVLALSFGAMIGWSWVLMTGHWVENAGSVGTLLAFLGGGLVIGFIALTYAELASAMPRAGGEHVYTHAALGANWSFVCTWALLMAYATVCVFESVALPTAVEYLVPGIRLGTLWTVVGAPVDIGFVLVGVLGAVAMTIVNYLGIRTAGRVQMVVTVAIVAAGVVLFVGAFANGSVETARPLVAMPAVGILSVVIMVPAMLVGFDVLPQSAEEIDLPAKRIGVLLAFSLVLAVLWYAGVSFAVASAIPNASLSDAKMATADAATLLWNSSWAGSALIVGGIGGILTSWNAFIIGGSRGHVRTRRVRRVAGRICPAPSALPDSASGHRRARRAVLHLAFFRAYDSGVADQYRQSRRRGSPTCSYPSRSCSCENNSRTWLGRSGFAHPGRWDGRPSCSASRCSASTCPAVRPLWRGPTSG